MQSHRYNRFLGALLISFLVPTLSWLGLAYFQVGATYPGTRFLRLQLEKKFALANSASDGPRLVVLSASSSMFGLRSKILEEKLDRKVLNFGLSINYGIEGLIFIAQKVLRSGDTLLLSLEYPLYGAPLLKRPNAETLAFAFSFVPDFFWHLDLGTQLRLAFTLSRSQLFQGVNAKLHLTPPPELKNEGALYPFESMNEYGEIANLPLTEEIKARRVDTLRYQWPDLTTGIFHQDTKKMLENFISECRTNEIQVLSAHPPMRRYSDTPSSGLALVDKIDHFYRSHDVPVINEALVEFWEDAYIFDDQYHLNEEGAQRRTHRLVGELIPYLKQGDFAKRSLGEKNWLHSGQR